MDKGGNVTRKQAGTKIWPFVFLNETGGEKAAKRSFPSLPTAGCTPKIWRFVLTHAHKHTIVYITP